MAFFQKIRGCRILTTPSPCGGNIVSNPINDLLAMISSKTLTCSTSPARIAVQAMGAAAVVAAALVVLSGCAATGASSPKARPVLYANAALNQAGDARARQDTDACLAKAQGAGLTPDEKTNEAGQRAGKGAATGAVAGALGALLTGGGIDGAIRGGLGGAAIGGSVGAVSGAMTEKASATYRTYVQRCLGDMGYEVIGWN